MSPTNSTSLGGWVARRWRRLALALFLTLVAYWILRGCLPSVFGQSLPQALEEQLRERYTVCVTDTPIWPGEPRQPECGQVTIEVTGEGVVPADAAAGTTRAICFRLTATNPSWTTQGTTRHEIVQHGRMLSKVALYQNGTWSVSPDEDRSDESLWRQFACPGPYRNQAVAP